MDNFVKNSTRENFQKMDEIYRGFFNVVAKYVLDGKHEENYSKKIYDKAIAIRKFYLAGEIHDNRKPNIRALFLSLKTLINNDEKKLKFIVYVNNIKEKLWEISYGEIDGMFTISQTAEFLGTDMEINLYPENTKIYFLEFFNNYTSLNITRIDIKIGSGKKSFYIEEIGIVFDLEDCAKIIKNKIDGKDVDEKKFDDCMKKIRHKPVYTNFSKKFIPSLQGGGGTWECSVCGLVNSDKDTKCIACETPREDGGAQTTNQKVETKKFCKTVMIDLGEQKDDGMPTDNELKKMTKKLLDSKISLSHGDLVSNTFIKPEGNDGLYVYNATEKKLESLILIPKIDYQILPNHFCVFEPHSEGFIIPKDYWIGDGTTQQRFVDTMYVWFNIKLYKSELLKNLKISSSPIPTFKKYAKLKVLSTKCENKYDGKDIYIIVCNQDDSTTDSFSKKAENIVKKIIKKKDLIYFRITDNNKQFENGERILFFPLSL